jgi:hypothetical protein
MGKARLVLSAAAPLDSAREFVGRRYMAGQIRTLHHQADAFYIWTGTCYREMQKEEIRAELYQFLDQAYCSVDRPTSDAVPDPDQRTAAACRCERRADRSPRRPDFAAVVLRQGGPGLGRTVAHRTASDPELGDGWARPSRCSGPLPPTGIVTTSDRSAGRPRQPDRRIPPRAVCRGPRPMRRMRSAVRRVERVV